MKDKILIGNHNISMNSETFGMNDSPMFDGIHMHGNGGCKEFTGSLVHMLSNVMVIQPSTTRVFRDNFSTMKPEINIAGGSKDDEQTNSVKKPQDNKTPNVLSYAVKTFNRFSSFLY